LGFLSTLQRLIPARQKINPAGEGNWHQGPYQILNQGWLPNEWGKYLNFWQMDLDPLPYPSCSVVEACVWAYIRAIAQLPGYHKRELESGGVETVTTSALSRLLRSPNQYETPSDFLVHLIRSLLLAGNSYWIAERNERSEVVALHWTNPRHVWVREVQIEGQAHSEVFYEISSENPLVDFADFGRRLIIPARDVLHIKLATPTHPLIGETWLAALAPELAQRGAINNSLTQTAANMRPSGILTTDAVLQQHQADELRSLWQKHSANMPQGQVPILSSGLKFQPVSLTAEQGKIIEQLKLSDQTIAAVFGVPAILLGMTDTATQKSAEAVMAEWLASGLGWLINHIEVAFDQFIGLNQVTAWREWTEFDTRVLLRSLFKERIDGLVRGVQGGIYSPNEARALEGYAAVEAGDEPRVQQQVVPLSFALEPPTPPAPPTAPPAGAPTDGGDGEDDDNPDEADRQLIAAIARARAMTSYETIRTQA
jgi:HK97 family phage portal protein